MKNYEYDFGLMTKMAAQPIYGKTLRKSSTRKTVERFPQILVCSIGDPSPSLFVQMMTLDCP